MSLLSILRKSLNSPCVTTPCNFLCTDCVEYTVSFKTRRAIPHVLIKAVVIKKEKKVYRSVFLGLTLEM